MKKFSSFFVKIFLGFLFLYLLANIFGYIFFSTKNFGVCEKLFYILSYINPSNIQNYASCSYQNKQIPKIENLPCFGKSCILKYGILADLENIKDENADALKNYQKSFSFGENKIFRQNYEFLLQKNSQVDSGANSSQNSESQNISSALERINNDQNSSPASSGDENFVIDKDGYIILEKY